MKYAVVKINNKQFKVSEGTILKLDRLTYDEGKTFTISSVLLYSDVQKTGIGQPELKNVKIKARVLRNFKDKKIEVRRFKAKSRYRKKRGYRQPVSEIRVEKIELKEVKGGP